MKRITTITFLVLLLVGAAACVKSPGDDPGPRHRWFNPYGQEVEDVVPKKCPVQEFPPPADIPPVPPAGAIPAGWKHTTYTLKVDAVKVSDPKLRAASPVFDLEYCIPVSLFVYVTASGMPATMVEMSDIGVTQHPLPWSALRNTPWRSTILVAWDPRTTAPVMNFDLSARHEVGPGLALAPAPTDAKVGMMCRIQQDAAVFSLAFSVDVFGPVRQVDILGPTSEYVTGPFVQCKPPAFSATAQ